MIASLSVLFHQTFKVQNPTTAANFFYSLNWIKLSFLLFTIAANFEASPLATLHNKFDFESNKIWFRQIEFRQWSLWNFEMWNQSEGQSVGVDPQEKACDWNYATQKVPKRYALSLFTYQKQPHQSQSHPKIISCYIFILAFVISNKVLSDNKSSKGCFLLFS